MLLAFSIRVVCARGSSYLDQDSLLCWTKSAGSQRYLVAQSPCFMRVCGSNVDESKRTGFDGTPPQAPPHAASRFWIQVSHQSKHADLGCLRAEQLECARL